MVEVLGVLRHAEEQAMDLFEDTAVDRAGWRDGTEAPEEGDGALEKPLEALAWDQFGRVAVVEGC